MKIRSLAFFVLFVMLLSVLMGCAAPAASQIAIESPSGKPSMSMPTAGSIYMTIKNTGTAADKLLSGSSPACGSIEVHETVMKSDGTMGMNLLDKPLEIPAGGQAELKSGGIHIMCIMKNEKFMAGSMIDLTLKFEKAGEIKISVPLGDGM